eukprot:GHVS01069523.1.p1 GENE.GHVS01069523.1~~GHVS01069523.1.p1  ORF type:complete len:128 (-),score=1.76 GHVS01069523.1:255-596(-)
MHVICTCYKRCTLVEEFYPPLCFIHRYVFNACFFAQTKQPTTIGCFEIKHAWKTTIFQDTPFSLKSIPLHTIRVDFLFKHNTLQVAIVKKHPWLFSNTCWSSNSATINVCITV